MTAAPGADAGRGDAALLSLIWLASPALPVGGFSYSEGLEAACEARLVTGEAEAARWLADQLDLTLARAELPAMLRAFDAWRRHDLDAVARINDWVRRSRESAEALRQAEQTGRSLAEWLRNGGTRSGNGRADGRAAPSADARVEALAALAAAPTWPVAFALAAAQTPAGARDAALAMAFGWAENMVQAAMKAVPLGQGAAQRLLGRLAAALPAAVDAACTIAAGPASVDGGIPGHDDATACLDLQAYAPMWSILSAQHEVQYSRLFRS